MSTTLQLPVRSVPVETDDVLYASSEVDWESALPARADTIAWKLGQGAKRALDIVGAVLGLIVLSPLFLAVSVLIVLDSGWPIFYVWRVVGERGRRFTGFKFRTMVTDADGQKDALRAQNHMHGPVFKLVVDPRVTRVGGVLRKLSIDELPQLWSVLVADMSLVGPRPMFPQEFCDATPAQRRKLAVRPGVTCLWQVSGRSNIRRFDDWVALDLEYIRTWTVMQDIRILMRTLLAVLRCYGAH